MAAFDDWEKYFSSIGIVCQQVPSNPNASQLVNVAGCPIFRAVETTKELDDLHTKARDLSSQMKRLVVLGMPFNNPQSMAALPGNILLPKARVYAGHVADTFSTSGHLIENDFLLSIKREVLAVISGGTKVKTPLCDWAQKLLSKNWVYGTPSSLAQLDSMLALLASETASIGHVRARQLSFGRGTGDALFLPLPSVILSNNSLTQTVEAADFRFISLESEIGHYGPARTRLHPVFSDKFLTIAATTDKKHAISMGFTSHVGASALGQKNITVTV